MRDFLAAWAAATLFSGLPSTVWAVASGGDPLEATRAAGAMVLAPEAPFSRLLAAAALVHVAVSWFWAVLLVSALPRRRRLGWAMLGATAIGVFDLRVLGPFFPEVYRLSFWPQMADHWAWGACLGGTLATLASRHRIP